MFPKGPNFSKLQLPSKVNEAVMVRLIKYEFYVFILKFVVSLIALIFGIILIFKGVISDSDIKFSFNGSSLEINKAWPGITLSILSIFLMLSSRLNIKITK